MPDYAPCSVMALEVQFSGPLFMDRHYGLGDLLGFLNVSISQGSEGIHNHHVELNITPHGVGIEGFLSCPCSEASIGSKVLHLQFCRSTCFQRSANAVSPLAWLLSLRQLEGAVNVIKVVHTVFIWVDGRGDAGASLRLWAILRLL